MDYGLIIGFVGSKFCYEVLQASVQTSSVRNQQVVDMYIITGTKLPAFLHWFTARSSGLLSLLGHYMSMPSIDYGIQFSHR